MIYPRSHPAPMETCGSVASMDPVSGKLTAYITSQAPHAHRTVYALVAGIPEHKIQVISPDIGGGFGNKVPIYPGYVLAVVGSIVTKRPVKWMEDRSSNLMTTGFARDYHMHGEIAATRDGKIVGVKVDVLADHGAFNATAQPTKYPAGFFHIFTGSYDYGAAHCKVTGVYTNKAPGGVAYACSFRITEAVYLIERIVDRLADELGMDPAELRLKNLLQPEQFPYTTPTGWEYDSGDYPRALREAMRIAGYDELRREQAEKRERGEYMGIGLSFFTEGVGAGPRKHMDILGLGMADGCELRVHPTGKAQLRLSVQTQGQGHETTFAQIVSHELGIPPEDIEVIHGDTDNTPFGLGTYASRSTPVSGAAASIVAQRVREKARIIAAASLECAPEDLEWLHGRWQVKGDPAHGKSMGEIALLAHSNLELPDGVEGHLDASAVYNPPNLTYPFGAYICVVDVDPGTGEVKVRRFIAVDDCGPRINPMIVEGQVHGGIADGIGMALMQAITFDEDGNCLNGTFMDYLLPTTMEVPNLETGETVYAVAAPPARRQGRRRVGHGRIAAGGRQRRHRRAEAVRRQARRHAADPRPGLARHPGPPRPHRPRLHVSDPSECVRAIRVSGARAVRHSDGLEHSDDRGPGRGAAGGARPVRARQGRARRAADERPPRRRGAGARRRHDGGLRRRRLRRGDGAGAGARRARLRRVRPPADQPDAGGPGAGQVDGPQPVPQRRHVGDLPRAASSGAVGGRRR